MCINICYAVLTLCMSGMNWMTEGFLRCCIRWNLRMTKACTYIPTIVIVMTKMSFRLLIVKGVILDCFPTSGQLGCRKQTQVLIFWHGARPTFYPPEISLERMRGQNVSVSCYRMPNTEEFPARVTCSQCVQPLVLGQQKTQRLFFFSASLTGETK